MKVTRAPVLVLLLLLASCVTSQAPLSSYDRAAIGYVEASIAYDAALDLAVTARANHLLSDDQWRTVDQIQRNVARAQPKARALLNVWKLTGEEPMGWKDVIAALLAEIKKLQEVQP